MNAAIIGQASVSWHETKMDLPPTVCKYRREMESTLQIAKSPKRTGRDGRKINTANIGKRRHRQPWQTELRRVSLHLKGSENNNPGPARRNTAVHDAKHRRQEMPRI